MIVVFEKIHLNIVYIICKYMYLMPWKPKLVIS